jgi:hypothetical protein
MVVEGRVGREVERERFVYSDSIFRLQAWKHFVATAVTERVSVCVENGKTCTLATVQPLRINIRQATAPRNSSSSHPRS